MGQVAAVFAGQGSQTPGMGREFYDAFPEARRMYALAEKKRPGVTRLCLEAEDEGPARELNQTQNAQPCLFLTELACAWALKARGVVFDAAAGFSLGEVPALCLTGVMDFETAFDFVCFRADAMQKCASEHPGAMLAVLRLTAGQTEALCASVPDAWAVNYNCPGQTVVACAEGSAEALAAAVAGQGGKAVRLAVSGAFHSPYMDGASREIADYLKNVSAGPPSVPLYANATGEPYGDAKALLARQVNSPVLWEKSIRRMAADGVDTFIELGPGKTLTGLIKKIDAGARTLNVCDLDSLQRTMGVMGC